MPDNNYFVRYIPLLVQVVVAAALAAAMITLFPRSRQAQMDTRQKYRVRMWH